MADVLSGRRNIEEVLRNSDGRKLTSFIGMGQLKYVDRSHSPIPLEAGDRLVLMSDGIYNLVNEDLLADILKRYPDVEQAAAAIERIIRETNHPRQDNYTAILLGF
jgi:serine/threonine protein phosphatase PrpC